MIKKEVTVGLRIGAMLLDHFVMTFAIMFLVLPFTIGSFVGITDESTTIPFSSGLVFYVMIFGMSLYFNKDMIQGKSVAKRALKLEVVDIKTGEVASSLKCFVRNLTIAVWPIEVIAVLISPARRIGDLIAGTRVEYITDERNSKPKVDFKNLILSVVLGFGVLYASSFLIKGKIGNGAFDNPNYIETSYNKTLSTQLENHLDSTRSDYLIDTHVKVYDTIVNDSLKYISALFYLKENYIDGSSFDGIKQDIFNSMYQIVPKSDFILMGKFIYDGQSTKQSTWRTYDWRKIDK
jgi:uncharacterized RDD family membrane protein YckC